MKLCEFIKSNKKIADYISAGKLTIKLASEVIKND